MLRAIWQHICNEYARRRFGLDRADIQHIRADLKFRLAVVEYAYFGKSGKKVARALAELKSLLGEKATHRYLGTLDPDLRTQFVERYQSRKRDTSLTAVRPRFSSPMDETPVNATFPLGESHGSDLGSNVFPIDHALRKSTRHQGDQQPRQETTPEPESGSIDSGE